jgi:hypothetical protein
MSAGSGYFRKRLEGWEDDPWSMAGPDGNPMLVVGVEEELLEAAEAVLKLMYEEVVPDGLTAVQLAKVGEGTEQSVHN